MHRGSPKFSLDRTDIRKIAIGAALAAAAAIIDYGLTTVIPYLESSPGVNATLVAIIAIVLNAARKWLTDTRVITPFWLALLLAASCGHAAELRLPESPVEPHTLIRLAVVDAEAVEDVMVMTARNSEVTFVDLEQSATAGTYVFTGPPGVYSIRVKCKGVSPLVGRVEVRGLVPFPPTPTPVPPVPPDPTPVPPVRQSLGIVILHESGSTTTEYERLYRSLQTGPEFTAFLWSSQHRLWILDDDLPQAQSWLSQTAARPGVVLFGLQQGEASSVVWAGELPKTAAELIALVKQHGG